LFPPGSWEGEEVAQIMYTHVSKCKNDKIKKYIKVKSHLCNSKTKKSCVKASVCPSISVRGFLRVKHKLVTRKCTGGKGQSLALYS
jgi:5S rRNA maturation endonuclease (ribonuclease M5)